MRWLALALGLSVVGCVSIRGDTPPGFAHAWVYCSSYAYDRCAGLERCAGSQERHCLATLGFARTGRGWVRVQTDRDLALEIERALASRRASEAPAARD